MKNLNKREKIMISILVIAIVSYAYLTYFLMPLIDKANTSRDQITGYKVQLEEIQNIIANNSKYQEDYNKALEKFNNFSVKMPYTTRDPEIVYNLKGLSDKAETVINSIGITDQENAGQDQGAAASGLVPVQVNISFNSKTYTNAMKFVDSIEKDNRIAQIGSVNISKGGNGGATAVAGVSGSITASYYYMKSTSPGAVEYKFNNGVYGKPDLFR